MGISTFGCAVEGDNGSNPLALKSGNPLTAGEAFIAPDAASNPPELLAPGKLSHPSAGAVKVPLRPPSEFGGASPLTGVGLELSSCSSCFIVIL